MQIEITYTYPPDADARQAAEELAQIDDTLAENAEALARRGALTEAAGRRAELRFTVRARAYLDRAHFDALEREGREWAEAQTGKDVDGELSPEEIQIFNLGYFRAGMLSSVDRTRTPDGYLYKAQTRTGPDEEWQPGHIPPEWTTLDGMGGEMPLALFTAWSGAARELNPGAGDFFGEGAIRMTRRA